MLWILLPLAAAGCVGYGRLYTRVVYPYSNDFRALPIGSKVCRLNEHLLKEPFSGAGVSVNWTSRIVAEAAGRAGITNLYFADLEILRIMDGVYERKTLILYGD